jgi:hypothetical protein
MKDLTFAAIPEVRLGLLWRGARNRRGAFARVVRIPSQILDSFLDLNPDSTSIHSRGSVVKG